MTQIQGAGGSLALHTQVCVCLAELQMSTDSQIAFLTTATLGQEGRGDGWMDGVRGSEMHPKLEKYRVK